MHNILWSSGNLMSRLAAKGGLLCLSAFLLVSSRMAFFS